MAETTPVETKYWYESKTVWASILQVVIGIAVSAGFLSATDSSVLLSEGPDLIVGGITIALGIFGVYGRIKATKQIAP